MADPGFVAVNSATTDKSTSLTVDIPVAASAGDRAILVASTRVVTHTTPTGWTLEHEAQDNVGGVMSVWSAVVGDDPANDPGNTVTVPLSGETQGVIAIYVTGPADIEDFQVTAVDNNLSGPPYEVSTPASSSLEDARLLSIYGLQSHYSPDQITWTPDGATTERVDITSTAGSFRNPTVMLADEGVILGGNLPSRTATASERVKAVGIAVVLSTSVTRPVADAGPDQEVVADATVNLSGSATDGGGPGGPYDYTWTQTSGPAVTLSPSNTEQSPSFTAPSVTSTLVFELVVTDSGGTDSLPDSVTIEVIGPENTAVPVADDEVTGWTLEPSTADGVYDVTSDSADSTYAESEESPSSQILRVKLSPLAQPSVGDNVPFTVRAWHANATSGSLVLRLKQGTSTIIASDSFTLSSTPTGYTLQLTDTEIGNITDPSNLYAEAEVSAS